MKWIVRAAVLAVVCSVPVAGQGFRAAWTDDLPGAQAVKALVAARTVKGFTPPKTPWGDPDVSGVFTTKDEANTPFERPDEWAGKRMEDITPQEFAAAIAKRQQEAVERAPFAGGGEAEQGVAIAVPIHWFDNLAARNARPWFVIDPPDGKVPPLTAAAQSAGQYNDRRPCADFTPSSPNCATKPDDRTMSDRCIVSFTGGPWKLPSIYGNSYQIVQTPDYVVIRHEMIHEARVVPLDGRSPVSPTVTSYAGNSRGRWDGNTLVVETTALSDRMFYRGQPVSKVRLIERYTRIAPNKVEWSTTMDDPATWTRPFTFSFPLTEDNSQIIFEYACHEGNFGMANIMTGRAEVEKSR
jgi:hypothetical protein